MLKKFLNKKYTTDSFKKLLEQKPPALDEVKKAISGDMDINAIDQNNENFLHHCIKKNLTSSAKLLISEGIDINILSSDGKLPMYLAIEKSNKDVARALVGTNNLDTMTLRDNRTLLQEAVLHGERYIVNLLLTTNINPNHIDNQGHNVIYDAVANGNERIIDTVLTIDDLDLNLVDNENNTVMHQNNLIEDDQLAIKFIKKGADPTVLDGDGKSYLLHAALRGIETEEIIDIALENGFNINSSLRNKNSILMEIMFSFSNLSTAEEERRNNLMSMATKLVKKGVDVNTINDQGETVLFDAIRQSDYKACLFLINEQVPLNIINNNGDSVLSLIIYNGMPAIDIIILLLKNGADVNIKNKYGQNLIEILNDLVLFTHGNINIREDLKEKITQYAQYIRLLSEMITLASFDTSQLSSTGEPIFFKSLLTDNRALFDLYYKLGININALDIHHNTIFLRYIDQVGQMKNTPSDFREVLLILITRKVDINMKDEKGKSILSRLIASKNMKMFRILFAVTKFDYFIQDKMGYTILHDCIVTSNIVALKLINQIVPKLKNIPDYSGILPITYAALFGKLDLVLELINLESHFTSSKKITQSGKNKFAPLLGNLKTLTSEDSNTQHKLNVFIEQIKRDFE